MALCCYVAAEQSPVNMSYWHLMCRLQRAPRAIMTSSTHTAGRYLGNVRVHLGNVRAFFIYFSCPTVGHDTHAPPEPMYGKQLGLEPSATWWLLSSLAGLGAVEHAAALKPPKLRGRGPELLGT
jgi:hypothetical protein